MRSVSQIKSRNSTKDPSLKVTPAKTLESRRKAEDRKDPVNQRNIELVNQSKSIEAHVQVKKNELEGVTVQLEKTKELLEHGIATTLNEAQKSARQIIDKAEDKRSETDQWYSDVEALAKALDTREHGLGEREDEMDKNAEKLELLNRDLTESQQTLIKIVDATNRRHTGVLESLETLSSLIGVATTETDRIRATEDVLRTDIGPLIEKIGSVYNEVIDRELKVKLDREFVESRSLELDTREAQIADSRKALKMAQKEINHG